MLLDLDKNDLISLVKGTEPSFSVTDNNPLINQMGTIRGGHNEYWEWNISNLKKCTEEKLYEIYIICKGSWND